MSRFRRRLMGLSALRQAAADDFVRVEYIENTSNAYIDTKIIQRSRNYEAVLRFQWVGSDAQLFETFYGYMFSTAKVEPRSGFHKYQGKLMFGTNNTETSRVGVDNNIHTVRLSSNATTQTEILYIDGVVVSRTSTKIEGIADNHLSFYLFCRNLGGVVNNSALCRIYSFDYKWFSDGAHSSVNAHWNFVPVLNRKNNEYGMFDLVGQKFYTSPNGTKFIGGHQIIYDAEIEYLRGTDPQYIDTGIIPNNSTGVYLKAYRYAGSDNFVIGCRNGAGNTRWAIGRISNSGWYYGWGRFDSSGIMNSPADIYLNYKNDRLFKVTASDGTKTQSLPSLPFTPIYNIRLFGSAGVNANYTKWNGRIYAVQITQGTEIIMDLIPVRVGNVGYMYDKVSNKLFGNNGSGSFILGQDTVVYDKI